MSESKGIQNGRKPLSAKQKPTEIQHSEVYGNACFISMELKKELEDQGFVPRWIDYKQMDGMGGYHKSGWRIYRRPKCAKIDNQEAEFGQNPDRLVRRGSLVLAYKTKEAAKKHKDFLTEKAQRYSANAQKKELSDFKKLASSTGLDTTVVTGYED